MSAERLRQAAQKIRETAGAATDGQWTSHVPNDVRWLPDVRTRRNGTLQEGIAYQITRAADAAHIVLWSPPVALAVADWLDDIATDKAEGTGCIHPRALALADLILGGTE